MRDNDVMKRIALGAVAGLAGTMALQQIRTQTAKALPETVPPMRGDPGEVMVGQAEDLLPEETREQIPSSVETAAAKSLALGYGMTAGAIYGALLADGDQVIASGIALGVGTWAVGYLGWLPALEIMPPVQQQETEQVVMPIAQHIAFGIATAATYRWLRLYA
jgi:hypothetical protein